MDGINILRNFNMNKLPILWELLRCRNVSAAANNLNLTQSTVSSALKYLREFFEDELLSLNGREYILTQRAQEIIPTLEALINNASDIIGKPKFSPETTNSLFSIATADYVSALIMPKLLAKFEITAPNIGVHAMAANISRFNEMKLGIVDLIIGPKQMMRWIDGVEKEHTFILEPCFEDPLVCIKASDNKIEFKTQEKYLNHPHAVVHIERHMPANIEVETLISLGLRQNTRIIVPNFTLLPILIENSQMVAVLPLSLALYYSKLHKIEIFQPPIDFPTLNLHILWLKGKDRDPKFKWFLEQVRECFKILSSVPTQ